MTLFSLPGPEAEKVRLILLSCRGPEEAIGVRELARRAGLWEEGREPHERRVRAVVSALARRMLVCSLPKSGGAYFVPRGPEDAPAVEASLRNLDQRIGPLRERRARHLEFLGAQMELSLHG